MPAHHISWGVQSKFSSPLGAGFAVGATVGGTAVGGTTVGATDATVDDELLTTGALVGGTGVGGTAVGVGVAHAMTNTATATNARTRNSLRIFFLLLESK